MEKFANYVLREKIHETRNSIIYRGHIEKGAQQFIIKLLKSRYPTPSEIAQFRQEYELIKGLDLEGVIKTFDIINGNDKFALVLEDFDSVSIKSLLDKKERSYVEKKFNLPQIKSLLDKKEKFDIKTFLRISAKIAETLGKIHEKEVVHRDIKPQNILINPITNEVKITDFGISAVITHENDEIYNPDFIAGTLAYMSPEQTGRMNRTVDYRADLYSFGITLYEMLTGSLPFKSQDPMELIHSHIAVMPEPPAVLDPAIPVVISDMIMRLLAKAPEERYQNGYGLLADIRECFRQLEEKQKIEAFELGRHDISNRFIIPQKLFGREKEISALLERFEDVTVTAKGAAVMVVAGAPGIGKSAMVNEIYKPIVARKGYFISGKYEQFRRDKPYSAIIQAFQVLVKQILSESEERTGLWKQRLLNVLGESGKIITEVIPEVELIIGKQPDLPALGPEESKNRFNFVFEKFTSVFPAKEHPVVLFLEDLQWADLASLQFMKNILTGSGINYFFLILSFRDNEVSEFHQVMDFLRNVEKSKVRLDRITLGVLTVRDITDLIKYFLRCYDEKGAELAELVVKKTGGNPFFVNQFLHTLYNEKMIVHEGALGWRWDAGEISRMQVAENLVDMMAGKIGKLSTNAQEILKICACIGNRFDLETVAAVRGTSVDLVLDDLTKAINEGLVSQLLNMYVFHHDRIQEAAYSLVPDAEKSGLHYKIGKLALDTADENELQKKLFYIVDQMNLGVNMIKGDYERQKLAKLNLEAGRKAKASAAYGPAFGYLQAGINLLEDQPWHNQYELTLVLYTESVEVTYMMGDYEKMDELAEIALKNARTTMDKANILEAKCYACWAQDDYDGAIEIALPLLKLLGVSLSKKPTQLRLAWELLKTTIMLRGKKPEDILDLPVMTDPEKLASLRLLASIGLATFFVNQNLFVLFEFKLIQLALKYGLAPEHAYGLGSYGVIVIAALGDIETGYRYGKLGLNIADKLNVKNQKARALFSNNMLIRHWKEPVTNSIESSLEGYRIASETGDLAFVAWNLLTYISAACIFGRELTDLEQEVAKHNKLIYDLKQKNVGAIHSAIWQFFLSQMGQSDIPGEMKGKAFNEDTAIPEWIKSNNRLALAVFFFLRFTLHLVFNKNILALEDARLFRKYEKAVRGVIIYANFYSVDSLNRISLYKDASWFNKIIHRIYIADNQRKMRKWAKHAPEGKLHYLNGVEAALDLMRGKYELADKKQKEALLLTRKHGDIVSEALSCEIFGKFYFSTGNVKKAEEYLTASYNAYMKWGASAKLKQLMELYSNLIPSPDRVSNATITDTFSTTSGNVTAAVTLDLSNVMQVSQVISSEIMLDRLLQKIMHMSVSNTGAQRGYLLLESEDKLTIEASEDVDKSEILVMQSIPLQECDCLCQAIVNYVRHSGKDVILGNAVQEGPFTDDPYIIRTQCKSILCTPILNKGKLSGILYMENNLNLNVFPPELLDVLHILTAQAATSIENARLFELATTDGLTKLYVHRYFQLLLDQEMQRSRQHNKPFALIMMDIDNFKAFNDTYGHQLGDEVLRSVARTVKKISSVEDILARYGGEEFVMILPEMDAQQAMITAEKIRASIEELEISHEPKKLHVTISLGVSTYPEHAGGKEALIHAADAALYTSKRNGKNLVSLFEKKETP